MIVNLPTEVIEKKILYVRGQKVMLYPVRDFM